MTKLKKFLAGVLLCGLTFSVTPSYAFEAVPEKTILDRMDLETVKLNPVQSAVVFAALVARGGPPPGDGKMDHVLMSKFKDGTSGVQFSVINTDNNNMGTVVVPSDAALKMLGEAA